MNRTKTNIVSSFFFYMWNSWCEEECKIVFGSSYKHFWDKWNEMSPTSVFGSAEKFYAELSENNRTLLVERACRAYDGNRREAAINGEYILRCNECGSADVELTAWVKPNHDNEYVEDCTDNPTEWCKECGKEVTLSTHEDFMKAVERWWENDGSGEIHKAVTGLCADDFSSVQEYRDTCAAVWNSKGDGEKIALWKRITAILFT